MLISSSTFKNKLQNSSAGQEGEQLALSPQFLGSMDGSLGW